MHYNLVQRAARGHPTQFAPWAPCTSSKVHGKLILKGYDVWASYLRKLGLSEEQILYALGTPQPLVRFATEDDAKKLGIRWDEVSLQNWRTCSKKFCLIVP